MRIQFVFGAVLPIAALLTLGCSEPSAPPKQESAAKPQQVAPTKEQAEASSKNLRQLAFAVLNYESTNGKFPLRAIKATSGAPVLSWRVQILPLLGEEDLYKEFHLDEPWDSARNKRLLAKMPALYKSPLADASEGETSYLAIQSDDSAFGAENGRTFASFSDGTSNTLLLVEVNNDQAVPWTKPADYPVDSASPMNGLGKLHPQGAFLVVTVTGETHLLQNSMDSKRFLELCTTRGHEIIDWEGITAKP